MQDLKPYHVYHKPKGRDSQPSECTYMGEVWATSEQDACNQVTARRGKPEKHFQYIACTCGFNGCEPRKS